MLSSGSGVGWLVGRFVHVIIKKKRKRKNTVFLSKILLSNGINCINIELLKNKRKMKVVSKLVTTASE